MSFSFSARPRDHFVNYELTRAKRIEKASLTVYEQSKDGIVSKNALMKSQNLLIDELAPERYSVNTSSLTMKLLLASAHGAHYFSFVSLYSQAERQRELRELKLRGSPKVF